MNVRIIDNFVPYYLTHAALAAWPDDSGPWVRYSGQMERKKAMHDWNAMDSSITRLLRRMLHLNVGVMLELDGPPLLADTLLWGGGLHEHGPGDSLGLHLDADRHPLTGMERRANAILFLSPWKPEWGGALEFWRGEERGVSVLPSPGRLVVFETSDTSIHGVPTPIACPADVRRCSLAVYWWSEPRSQACKRLRAEFVGGTRSPNLAK